MRELHRWTAALEATGLELRRLARGEYEPVPWDQLRDSLMSASAVVLFGFRQLCVHEGTWRPGTGEERAIDQARWTTPWMHIEAGMAIARGLPLLVVAEAGVAEGVFNPDAWGSSVFGASLDRDPSHVTVAQWRSAF
ncbi:hypothetical protein [Geodermatophilus obscurus]|uniref:hypothetical protein n=1 Tax=Geodermatophilus obscurus TaxID=1861 RepID=UPI001140EBF1|nr:hypothetical protein [Geodermatophilus obscurus]